MTAVKHGNGRDWRLITHKYCNSDFYPFLLTPNGVVQEPIQSVGAAIDSGSADLGQLIFSRDGDELALANYSGQMEVFDFDRCTGNLSLKISLGGLPYNRTNGFYGCSFSYSGKYLYASTKDSLFQFDLTSSNIMLSKKVIFVNSSPYEFIGQHLINLNEGVIYIALLNFQDINSYKFLSKINLPELADTLCNFQLYSFSLNGRNQSLGLPNLPNYNLGRMVGSLCDTLTSINSFEQEQEFKTFPNPTYNTINVLSSQGIVSYKLINIEGVVLKEVKLNNCNSLEVNVRELKAGVYFLNLVTEKNSFVSKIIKE